MNNLKEHISFPHLLRRLYLLLKKYKICCFIIFFGLLGYGNITAQSEFIITYNTTNAGVTNANSFRIPAVGGSYNVDIGNDGSFELTGQTGSIDIDVTTHGYSAGLIQVAISGTFQQIRFSNGNDDTKLTSIDQWGTIAWTSMNNAFRGCSNMTMTATDTANVSGVSDFNNTFRGASNFNGDISGWDVSSGTDFSLMFNNADAFNQDISGWNVSSGVNFRAMFRFIPNFNQDISGWNVSNGEDFGDMFRNSTGFNQNLGSWNVGSMTDGTRMFENSALSVLNWDATLIGWHAQNFSLASTEEIGADGLQYCGATAERQAMIDAGIFTFTGDTQLSANCNPANSFILTYNTQNTGATNSNSLRIPGVGTYDVDINNDGTFELLDQTGTTDIDVTTHGYTAGGIQVAIRDAISGSGTFQQIQFNDGNDDTKLTSIDQWGTIGWTSMANAFQGCSNMTMTATDTPNLSGVSDFSNMFNGATAFNQNIGSWNIGTMTSGANMLDNSGLSITNWDATLSGWDAQNFSNSNTTIGAAGLQYCGATAQRQAMIDAGIFTFSGDSQLSGTCSSSGLFILTYNTTNSGVTNSNTFRIPAVGGTYDVDIGNDGSFELLDQTGSIDIDVTTHGYAAGSIQVAIRDAISGSGTFQRIQFSGSNDHTKLTSIDQWGAIGWTSMLSAFHGCSNMTMTATDTPNLSGVSVFTGMFNGASSFNGDISNWNVGSGTSFSGMFFQATSFNQNIGSWNVSNGTSFISMFFGATSFNQNLGSWNIGSMTNGTRMFEDSGLSVLNWDATLIGWHAQNFSLASTEEIGADGLQYCGSTAERQAMIDAGIFTFTGDTQVSANCNPANSFILTYNTTNSGITNSNSFRIPAVGGLYDVDVNNDGTFELLDQTGSIDIDVTTHSYAAGSIQVAIRDAISGSGTFQQIQFNDGNDDTKLTSIDQWGTIAWTSMDGAFYDCSNMTMTATDTANVSGVSDFRNTFRGADSFNGDISGWDVSSGTDFEAMFNNADVFNQDISGWNVSNGVIFRGMFLSATGFNQNLGSWDVSSGTNFRTMFFLATSFNQNLGSWNIGSMTNGISMFDNSGLSVLNWDATLIGWHAQNFSNSNITITADGLQYCGATAERQAMIDASIFTFFGDTQVSANCNPANSFILTYNTQNTGVTNSNSLRIPGVGTYDVDINNDGTFELLDQTGSIDIDVTTHGYTAGSIQVAIRDAISGSGTFQQIQFNDGNDDTKLTSIDQWGTIGWTSMANAFEGCSNMTMAATDTPNLTGVTDFSSIFSGASSFNGNISSWNVSSGINFSSMFNGVTAFNQNIGSWNVSSGTDFSSMFNGVTAFNQNIGSWNVSSGVNFSSMFNGATAFNQNIGSWVVSSGTNFSSMFNGVTAFNQNIGSWNVSSGVNFSSMFNGATAFNQNIGSWVVSSGTDFSSMFNGATVFNQSLGNWNISAMTSGANMLDNSGLSVTNWDATLSGWHAQNFSNSNVTIGATGLQYCDATAQRQAMIDAGIFTFTGDSQLSAACDPSNLFILTYNTQNSGVTNNDSFRIPAVGGLYDVDVNNDGTFELTDQTGSIDIDVTTHGYAAGSIQVAIRDAFSGSGTLQQIQFNDGNDDTKLTSIDQWGAIGWTSMVNAFHGCSNMDMAATDTPNLSGVSDFSNMFNGATAFNQNIGSWNIGTMTSGANMLDNSGLSIANWDATLSGWHAQNFSNSNVTIGATGLQYCGATAQRQSMIDTGIFTFTGDTELSVNCDLANSFILTYNTTNSGVTNSNTFRIPGVGTYDVDIGNDGSFELTDQTGTTDIDVTTHGYTAGSIQVAIRDAISGNGVFEQIQFNDGNDDAKLTSIDQWGTIAWTSMNNAFHGCSNMTMVATDIPNLTGVSDFTAMFAFATSFNGDISSWNVSSGTNFEAMFAFATSFNQNLTNWNVSSGTNFSGMFVVATSFNQDISSWDVSSGTSFTSMFDDATSFNQDISSWNVSSGTDFSFMFFGVTGFNQNIGSWDVSGGTNFSQMFNGASSFNQDLSNWNVSNGEDFREMFKDATSFNQDIGSWDVSSGTTFSSMFEGATAFNQNLNSWDVSSGIFFFQMFRGATSFNGDISSWDVSSGTRFEFMFQNATSFNQDIGSWDVSSGTTFSSMFSDATSFNQNLGNWNLASLTLGRQMLDNSGLSVTNWDATLVGWHAQNFSLVNEEIGATGLQYCGATAQRQAMIDAGIFIFTGDTQLSAACDPSNLFILTYNTQNSGVTNNDSFRIPGVGTYDVDIGNDGTFELLDQTGSIDIDLTGYPSYSAGLIQVAIRDAVSGSGTFQQIQFNDGNDDTKLTSIDQWGTIAWTSMANAFEGCSNMTMAATDTPNLTGVTDFSSIFSGASSFNGNISSWNVSSGINFSSMFNGVTAFNQNIGSWNVSSGTDFSSMFNGVTAFNQNIGSWNVSSGVNFSSMFNGATAFNQNIGSWVVSSGTNFSSMFNGATAFNQNIGSWIVSSGVNFSSMFNGATAFNQNIGSWVVSSGTDFSSMFNGATAFNQNIGSWVVSSGVNFSSMFNGATVFNQNIGSWDVSSGTDFSSMFNGATVFNQSLGNWNIGAMTSGVNMLNNSGLSATNWDATLSSWHAQNFSNSNVTIGATGLQYCDAAAQRQAMIDAGIFTFTGDSQLSAACDPSNLFILTYNTQNSGVTNNDSFRIPAVGGTYDVDVNNDGTFELTDQTGSIDIDVTTHGYAAGSIQVAIRDAFSGLGTLQQIQFNDGNDDTKLTSIDQWGAIGWTSMANAFHGCSNMTMAATDTPNLTGVTDFSSIFSGASSFNGNISSWNVSSGINFSSMFNGATAFNQDIGSWNVSSGTNFSSMFNGAMVFNQDIGSWVVSSGTDFSSMFNGATVFNQSLGNWNIGAMTSGANMLDNSGLSTVNWDATLIGWHAQSFSNSNVTIGVLNLQYCDATAQRQAMIDAGIFTFTGDTPLSAACDPSNLFILTYNTQNSGVTDIDSFRIPAVGGLYDVDVNNDGTFELTDQTGSIDIDVTSHGYAAGSIQVAIRDAISGLGTLQQIQFNDGNADTKLTSIDQWGTIAWTSMANAFQGCSNMTMAATDTPNLTGVTDFSSMFSGASSFNGNISSWNVSSGVNFSSMFNGATAFNQNIGSWNVSSGTDFSSMFNGVTAFNQNIGSWNVSSGVNFSSMFNGATAFNQNIGSWVVSSGTDFISMFNGATAFNQNISSWNVSSGTNFSSMFNGTTAFNQNIGSWNVSSGANFSSMFNGATVFNQSLGNWNIGAMTSGANMLDNSGLSTVNWDATLIGWHAQSFSNSNVTIGVLNLQYCDATAQRQAMIDAGIFTFTGDTPFSAACDPSNLFILTYNTQNSGVTNSNSFRIPAVGGLYDVDVNNDGTFELTDQTGSIDIDVTTHGYAAGSIQVAIRDAISGLGTLQQIQFNDGNDDTKLTSIDQWGAIAWTSMANAFEGCSNMTMAATDTPNLTGVTDFPSMFSGATAFNQDLSSWNVSSGTNFSSMFNGATAFNQSLGNWNIGAMTSGANMLDNSGLSTVNWDATLIGWHGQSFSNSNVTIGALNLQYCDATVQRQAMITASIFTFTGDTQFSACASGNTFILTYNTLINGTTNFSTLRIPAVGGRYDVDLGNDGSFELTDQTGSIDIDVTSHGFFPGSIQVAIRDAVSGLGTLQQIRFENTNDDVKLTSIDQWGAIGWISMADAFQGCSNMTMTATDTPNLTGVTDFSNMFAGASNFNSDINSWDVSSGATFSFMFQGASSFNGDISSWNVSAATDLSDMFNEASSFNRDISSWNVSNATDFSAMFAGASGFNQNIGSWNVSNATDFSGMFAGASGFNQNIGSWNVSNATSFSGMFFGATSFNQDVETWNVSSGTDFPFMFNGATNFNQSLGSWNIGAMTNGGSMLDNSGLSAANWDATLIGWHAQNFSFVSAMNIGVAGLQYCDAGTQRQAMIDAGIFTFTGDTQFSACASENIFILTYNTANSGITDSNSFRIPSDGGTYDVDIGNDGSIELFDQTGFTDIDVTTHGYTAGSIQVAIRDARSGSGTLQRIRFGGNDDTKLTSIDQWGAIGWTSMNSAFRGCSNMTMTATDTPNLTGVSDFSLMFRDAISFNGDIGSWNVSNATNFTFMFLDATSFNQDISGWDVSSVTTFRSMFQGATSFNQDLTNWDVSSVTVFRSMFQEATSFNGDISSWNVSSAIGFVSMFQGATSFNRDISSWDVSGTNLFSSMFSGATSFNQDISGWNVGSGVNFIEMFQGATAFNQNLGSWNIGAMSSGTNMLDNSGLSTANWDATLIGWHAQNFSFASVRDLGAAGLEYCDATVQRQAMIDAGIFTFTGDTQFSTCGSGNTFILTYNTNNPGVTNSNSLRIPAAGTYDVDLGNDGTFELLDQTGSIDIDVTTHGYAAGSIQVAIRDAISGLGTFQQIQFVNGNDDTKLTSIDQWGAVTWTSMANAFYGCSNMTMAATDTPNVSTVFDFTSVFQGATNFNGNISNWNVSSGTNFFSMFNNATSFNGDISSWNVSSGTNFNRMFLGATSFNGDISSWNVSNGTSFSRMFQEATVFDQNIGGWNVSSGQFFNEMFDGATAFNQNIGSWDVGSGTIFSAMFRDATSFNVDVSSWNVSSGTDFFQMFISATSFNADIGNWDVSSGTDFEAMLQNATSFNHDLGSWNIGNMTNGIDMLDAVGLSVANWDATLIGWHAQNFSNSNVTIGTFDLKYCGATVERQAMIDAGIFSFTEDLQTCLIVSQVYENAGGRVIELTNTGANTISSGLTIILFRNTTGDLTGVTPTSSYSISTPITSGGSLLLESSGLSGVSIINNPSRVVDENITNYSGGNDVLVVSSSTNSEAWANRLDVIETFSNTTSYVRHDDIILGNKTFTASEWTAFVDDALDPLQSGAQGGPERHPHDPLISEVMASPANMNMGLGYHRTGITVRTGGAWSNGTPDCSRRISIDENYNHTGSSLPARTLTITNDSKLTITDMPLIVTDNITLTGTNDEICLAGTSQLITTHTSGSLVTGNGKLYVDQNSDVPSLYRFNYFGSPVNSIGMNTYTVADVMKDGTELTSDSSTPLDINFIAGVDGATTSPISIANHWIYTFGASADWSQVFSTGSIPQSDGFIFKGPGQVQNYTFVGTPKDGTIQATVAADTPYLVGNPYPSAIRTSKFIEDNIGVTTATLYFWEQKENANGEVDNNGHNFAGYVGGYAIRNLAMGLAANNISGETSSTAAAGLGEGPYKEPGEYIAVGQGFFVTGSNTGGTIEFNNSQRAYITEGTQSVFFRNTETDENPNGGLSAFKLGMDYIDDDELELHRQIGISFIEGNSFAFEKGYDSQAFDLRETDIYWDFSDDETPYFIAGVQAISDDLEIPLTIVTNYNGDITLMLDEWDNIDRDIFFVDKVNGTSHLISEEAIILSLISGEYKDRFFITFGESSLSTGDEFLERGLQVYADQSRSELVIKNNGEFILKEMILYDLVGKEIRRWSDEIQDRSTESIRLPFRRRMSGVYLIKLNTDQGVLNKKVYLDFD